MGMENWKHFFATIGTIMVDLGKLSFGSLILGSILRGNLDPFQTFFGGVASAMLLFVLGVVFILKSKE
jgi:Ca2+/H+ antiporter